ncbi:MAG TPA: ATP-dependent DNA ligase [Amnibacterium sp.]|jgi:hypothetical protein
MGTFTYDGWSIEFEDRILAHLQLVIIQRLRRQESFAVSWLDALSAGDGRSSIWLHPAALMYFRFAGSKQPTLDGDWIHRLNESAKSSLGLIVTTEDGRVARSLSTKRM